MNVGFARRPRVCDNALVELGVRVEDRAPGVWVVDLTATYRLNGRRVSQVWALQLKNALGATDSALDYSFLRDAVVDVDEGFPLPVLSYTVEW